MSNDSVVKTFIVAFLLCVICSVLVSGSAVSLKPMQKKNAELDIKKNLLVAMKLLDNPKASEQEIMSQWANVKEEVIDLETGETTDIDPKTFDQKKAAKDPKRNVSLPKAYSGIGIKVRSKYAKIYKIMKNGMVDLFVFPIHGKGLWSTMYGFIGLETDMNTIRGLGFYAHGETPGLGGEVDNPRWKAQWTNKKVYKEGEPLIQVVKGMVDPSMTNADYKVDGLAGATITSNGVTYTVQYWLGEHGFGPYIEKAKMNRMGGIF